MSFFRDINTLYFTKQISNTNTQEEIDVEIPLPGGQVGFRTDPRKFNVDAVIEQRFNTPLVTKGSDWLLGVERFEVNLNGIPYYDNTFEIGFREGAENHDGKMFVENLPNAIRSAPIVFTRPAFSLIDLIEVLNESLKLAINPLPGPIFEPIGDAFFAEDDDPRFILQPDGRVRLIINSDNWHFNKRLRMPPFLFGILGIRNNPVDLVVQPDPAGPDEPILSSWVSQHPRWDMGGFADHIRIVSNLGTTSDNVAGAQSNIVTDLSVSASRAYTTSMALNVPDNPNYANLFESNFSGTAFSPRQKIVYAPDRLRWLNIIDPSPIINLRVEAKYVLPDGITEFVIPLPPGASFGIKLAFYSRK